MTDLEVRRMGREKHFRAVAASMATHLCDKYGISLVELYGEDRECRSIQKIRAEFWYSIHKAGAAYSEVGRIVARRHTSVMRQCRELEKVGFAPIPVCSELGNRTVTAIHGKVVESFRKARLGNVEQILTAISIDNPTDSNKDQRERFRSVGRVMCDLSVKRAAVLWRHFCQREWPNTWRKQVAQPPRFYAQATEVAA